MIMVIHWSYCCAPLLLYTESKGFSDISEYFRDSSLTMFSSVYDFCDSTSLSTLKFLPSMKSSFFFWQKCNDKELTGVKSFDAVQTDMSMALWMLHQFQGPGPLAILSIPSPATEKIVDNSLRLWLWLPEGPIVFAIVLATLATAYTDSRNQYNVRRLMVRLALPYLALTRRWPRSN